jgi:hypothetical protein
LLYEKGYTGPVKHFEAVSFSYDANNVELITGAIVNEKVPLTNSTENTTVLVHNALSQNSTFFVIPQKILPPGTFNVTLIMKTSTTITKSSISLIGYDKQNQTLFTKQINSNNLGSSNKWEVFSFTFTLNQPTFVKFSALVTNSTPLYFHSMTVSQQSGSP